MISPPKTETEYFDIVDDNGDLIGTASREECHGNPSLVHRTIHVVVLHPDGRMLLQKRREDRDIQPGKWDTAVGGHLHSGESHDEAMRRELREELGVFPDTEKPAYLMDMKIRNDIESENIRIYSLVHPGPFEFQQEEISDVRFWEIRKLRDTIENTPDIFTPNFIREFGQLEAIPGFLEPNNA